MVHEVGKDELIIIGTDPDDGKSVLSLPKEQLKPIAEMYLKYTPKELVDHIDQQFKLCRKQGVKRTSYTWGIWSTAMNLSTKQRVKDKDPESDKLELTFQYWTLISQLLDLYFKKSRWFGRVKIKQKHREIKAIRRLIV